jgi:hypothetical protein
MKTTTTNPTVTVLENANCRFSVNFEKKEVSGRCLKDQHNEPRCYNKTSRSLKKAWAALVANFKPDTTMYGAQTVLDTNGVNMRSYCAMD